MQLDSEGSAVNFFRRFTDFRSYASAFQNSTATRPIARKKVHQAAEASAYRFEKFFSQEATLFELIGQGDFVDIDAFETLRARLLKNYKESREVLWALSRVRWSEEFDVFTTPSARSFVRLVAVSRIKTIESTLPIHVAAGGPIRKLSRQRTGASLCSLYLAVVAAELTSLTDSVELTTLARSSILFGMLKL